MGCDIHLHTEIKINGKREHYSQPRIKSSYILFAKMAGVRQNKHDPLKEISLPKGLPSDCSATTRFCSDFWGEDGHSHSYLTSEEIKELWNWLRITKERFEKNSAWSLERDEWGYLFGNSWDGFHIYPEDIPKGLEDIRYVFWFDN